MNIMNRLTRKHMLTNKKRTLVTILGIIISVAMFTAVFTGVTSILSFFQRNAMSDTGFWHVEYQGITNETASILENDSNTENISFYKDLGYSKFESSTNELKPYIYLSAMDDNSYEMMNIKLVEGRFPADSSEIVIPKHLLKFSDHEYKVGDTITITLGERYLNVDGEKQYLDQNSNLIKVTEEENGEKFETTEAPKEYRIVGITERPNFEYNWAPGFSAFTKLTDYNQCNARIYLKNVTKSIYEDSRAMQEENNISSVQYNNSVLSYYGISRYAGFNRMINGLIIILVIIIMIGSISLIYNSFAISISERTKQFGMLASVGATKKQKLRAVLYEGVICGCISIPIGMLSGILGLSITFKAIGSMIKNAFQVDQPLIAVISLEGIIITILLSMITILISAYLPARKASKITPMEAIWQQKDIKIKHKNVKNWKLVRILFGLEGDLALKNLKRNKKRYRTIVFSLGISIVLFISVNSYTYYLSKSIEVAKGTNEGDIAIGGLSTEEINAVLPDLKALDTLTDLSVQGNFPGYYQLSESDSEHYSTKDVKDYCKENGMIDFQMGFSIYLVPDETYQELQKEMKTRTEKVPEDSAAILIVNQQRSMKDYSVKDIKPLNIANGDVLTVSQPMNESGEEKSNLNLYMEGEITNLPLGIDFGPIGIDILAFMSMSTYEQVISQHKEITGDVYYRITANTTDPDSITTTIKEIFAQKIPGCESYVSNQAEDVMRSRQIIAIFNIFAYGFITLISLISVANICNTISTSFSIRRREFAMIKSVGMTPHSFHKMIVFESLLYGIKSLLLGLPVGAVFNYLIYRTIHSNLSSKYGIPYMTYVIAAIFVFLIVGIAMLYSTSKTRKDNIIDGLKSEII